MGTVVGGGRGLAVCPDGTGGAEGGRARPDIVCEILMTATKLERRRHADVGEQGNKRADWAAKESLGRDEVDVGVWLGKMECRSITYERLHSQWQQDWEGDSSGRKLYNIQPSVQPCKRVNMPGADDIKLTRLRLTLLWRVGWYWWGSTRMASVNTVE